MVCKAYFIIKCLNNVSKQTRKTHYIEIKIAKKFSFSLLQEILRGARNVGYGPCSAEYFKKPELETFGKPHECMLLVVLDPPARADVGQRRS